MVDEIIVMQDGGISERGSYEELVSHDGPFAQFLKTYLTEQLDSEGEGRVSDEDTTLKRQKLMTLLFQTQILVTQGVHWLVD